MNEDDPFDDNEMTSQDNVEPTAPVPEPTEVVEPKKKRKRSKSATPRKPRVMKPRKFFVMTKLNTPAGNVFEVLDVADNVAELEAGTATDLGTIIFVRVVKTVTRMKKEIIDEVVE